MTITHYYSPSHTILVPTVVTYPSIVYHYGHHYPVRKRVSKCPHCGGPIYEVDQGMAATHIEYPCSCRFNLCPCPVVTFISPRPVKRQVRDGNF